MTYDVRISGEPIQDIDWVSSLKPKYMRERTGDFSDSRLANKLGSLSVKIFVAVPEVLDGIDHKEIETVDIVCMPELGKGRHESRTGVAFGQLVIERTHNHLKPISELVAAKYTNPNLAAREFAANRVFAKRLGEKSVYVPLGFMKDTNRPSSYNTALVTRYQHEATTLDSVFWNENASSEERLAHAALAGVWLGRLHDASLAHGDAQAKNIAFGSDNEPHYPDLETASDLVGLGRSLPSVQLSDIDDFLKFQEKPINDEEFAMFAEGYLSENGRMPFSYLKTMRGETKKPNRFSKID